MSLSLSNLLVLPSLAHHKVFLIAQLHLPSAFPNIQCPSGEITNHPTPAFQVLRCATRRLTNIFQTQREDLGGDSEGTIGVSAQRGMTSRAPCQVATRIQEQPKGPHRSTLKLGLMVISKESPPTGPNPPPTPFGESNHPKPLEFDYCFVGPRERERERERDRTRAQGPLEETTPTR